MANMKAGNHYGQVEINSLVSSVTGARYSQLPYLNDGISAGTFDTDSGDYPENGMFLVYDTIAGHWRKPADNTEDVKLIYSEDWQYMPHERGTKFFAHGRHNEFIPRGYEISVGDKITTNQIELGAFAADATSVGHYASVNSDGILEITGAAVPAATVRKVFRLTKFYTLPSGDPAFKVECIR